MTEAANSLIRQVQWQCFPETMARLSAQSLLLDSDKLLPLCPFLMEDIMRVGGRLRHSPLPLHERHPTLLPHRHRLTELVIRQAHEQVRHQGRHLTAAAVRQMGFHVVHHRSAITKYLQSCVSCRRQRGGSPHQLMADLPLERLARTPPFLHSGVDVFGPYMIHDGRTTRRTQASKKTWVLLITCLYSRAIHVEMLSSLDTPTFKLALRRFFATRGSCRLFRSDCGTNFTGAQNSLQQELNIAKLVGDASDPEYSWKFLPPGASHMAGVWERKIGSIKHIFDATMSALGRFSLSREEFHTLICETANIVNQTPLAEVSSDVNDPFPVSPASLLTLRDSTTTSTFPALGQGDLLAYGKLRWKRVQALADLFWDRWRADYLYSLDARRKWKKPQRNVSVGDVVLLRDTAPRCTWPMGVVLAIEPSPDLLVRAASIRLRSPEPGRPRIVKRAIHNLVLILKLEEQ